MLRKALLQMQRPAETALTIKRNALKTMRLPAEVASPLSRASKVVLPQSMFRNA